MLGLDEIRKIARALPEVEEGPPVRAARRIAAFKVVGKSFVRVETGGRTMTASLSQEEGEAIRAAGPGAYEAIWRNEETFLGLRADLAQLDEDEVRDLIERSWRHRAKQSIKARRREMPSAAPVTQVEDDLRRLSLQAFPPALIDLQNGKSASSDIAVVELPRLAC